MQPVQIKMKTPYSELPDQMKKQLDAIDQYIREERARSDDIEQRNMQHLQRIAETAQNLKLVCAYRCSTAR